MAVRKQDGPVRSILELAALFAEEGDMNVFKLQHFLSDARARLCLSSVNGYEKTPRYTLEQQKQMIEHINTKNYIRNYKFPGDVLEKLRV